MPRKRPPVSAKVLRWALDESGLSREEVASRLDVPGKAIDSWAEGKSGPTQGEFTKLAKLLRRPPSVFFLPSPPRSSGVPPNLRRAVGRAERDLRAEELREVRRARRMQRLISFLLHDQDEPSIELPPLAPPMSPESVGDSIRSWLGISQHQQEVWASSRNAFDGWRDSLEARGILVMQLRLGSGGLRGFSLGDDYAPLIAVNTAENLQARIFTLLHEAAHLTSATGTSCLEGVDAAASGTSIERWCDRVSSAAVLPHDALVVALAELSPDQEANFDVVRKLADRFKISLRATAVALIRAGLARQDLYAEVEEQAPASDYEKGFARGTGQRAPRQRLSEVGPRIASVLLGAMSADGITERETRQYLRLDGTELTELAAELGNVR